MPKYLEVSEQDKRQLFRIKDIIHVQESSADYILVQLKGVPDTIEVEVSYDEFVNVMRGIVSKKQAPSAPGSQFEIPASLARQKIQIDTGVNTPPSNRTTLRLLSKKAQI